MHSTNQRNSHQARQQAHFVCKAGGIFKTKSMFVCIGKQSPGFGFNPGTALLAEQAHLLQFTCSFVHLQDSRITIICIYTVM